MKELNFNTLDNLVDSNHWQEMVGQACSSIKAMQTNIATPKITPHIVPPIFQKQEVTQYVLAVSGEQRGPFTLTQIQQMLKAKVINSDFYIWTNGWPEWKLIKDCTNIISEIE